MDAPLHLEPGSPSWPPSLSAIDAPPDNLWARGRVELLARESCVAVVGSRAPSPYGEEQAHRFGRELAAAGICVVSGLARGVDQAAHRGALAAGGDTIAVLGCGVDRPWPEGPLAGQVAERGLLLSEFPPGQGPRRHHFPLRNRLISGLSQAVLVVEAAATSGSLITARWALDQGRTVFALPGRIDHPMAYGTLRLIRDGATPALSPREMLLDLGITLGAASSAKDKPSDEVFRILEGETLTADEIAQRLERPVSTVLVELVQLELAGWVARGPGGLWRVVVGSS